jgi:hypothetical protein
VRALMSITTSALDQCFSLFVAKTIKLSHSNWTLKTPMRSNN